MSVNELIRDALCPVFSGRGRMTVCITHTERAAAMGLTEYHIHSQQFSSYGILYYELLGSGSSLVGKQYP